MPVQPSIPPLPNSIGKVKWIPDNLIINADDFGIDPEVSKGIALCVEKGLINSFSVLPFTDTFQDELLRSLIKRFPEIRIGSHLSLLTTASLLPSSGDSPNLNEHAHHYRDFIKLYSTGRYPAARIYQEWKTQIHFLGKYLGSPGRLSHMDSHQHLHVLPGIWPVAVALQKEFNIPRLRVPYESLTDSLTYKFPFGLVLQALAYFRWRNLRSLFRAQENKAENKRRLVGFFTSTRFTVAANRKRLMAVLEHPENNYELMVHPTLADDREIKELELLQDFYTSLMAKKSRT